ncbi:DUF4214 domain-containing protein [Halomonas titanicae]|uniref:DUF4214 domain-containing protein n=1 Tax=Vreelandella titanicae TaxID=664683 RepID=UPI001F48DBC5|nr:DUF4214 domain-containing protein [Halomonas titanicae]MCE7520318.1 DUF4214 domain-containing protein [Halomonas titanicae]
MNNNLTLSVTLTGDNRQLSGTLRDAQGDVREFSTTTVRESKKAETALEAPGRQAGTVSEHLRGAQREARTFGTETAQGGRQATQALTQTSNEAQTTAGHLNQLKAVAVGVGVAFTTMGVRDFVTDTYAAVSGSQQLQASLKTVTGSIENASTAWDTLLGFAADTPFTLDQSVQGFIRMQSLGLNPTLEALRSYGNTSAAMGKDMMQMVEAVADATTGEFERLKEFGIRASKEGEQISFTFQGVTTTVANSANAISQYLQQIGENQFAGAMADQMDTLSGKASNLEDTIYQFYLAIGDAGATDVFEGTLANASNTVQFLTNNIDSLATVAESMVVLVGGRVAVALTTATTAMVAKTLATQADVRAEAAAAVATTRRTAAEKQTALALLSTARLEAQATQGTAAHTFALQQLSVARTRAATAAGAHTAAMNTATAATARASVAARGLSGALALVGGPLGLLVGGAGLLYIFREELGLTVPQVDANTTAVNKLTNGLDDMSQAAAQLTLTSLVGQLAEVRAQAEVTAEEFLKVGQIEGNGGGGFLGVDVTAQTDAVRELGETSNATQQEAANLEAAIALVKGRIGELGERNEEVTPTITEVGDASKTAAAHAKELAKSTQAQADALEDLYDRLIPGRRETVQLARDIQTLNLAIAMGTGNIGQNIQAMGLLQQQFIEAQNDTDDLAKKTVDAAFTMEGAFDELRLNGLRRLDDGFADLWQGAIDGSLNASDIMKRVISQTLAEMAHMAITRPIVVEMQGMMGMSGTTTNGQQSGMSLQSINPQTLRSGWDTVSGWFGGGSNAAAGGVYNNVAGSGYTGALGNATSSGATVGSTPIGGGGMATGIYSAGAAYVGGWAGSEAAGMFTDKQANSNYGEMIGTAVGTYVLPVIGTAIGSFLGSAADTFFGSEKISHGELGTESEGYSSAMYRYGEDTTVESAFGAVGITSKKRTDDSALMEMANYIAEVDNALASVMTLDQTQAAKEELDGWRSSNNENIGSIIGERLSAVSDAVTTQFDDALKGLTDNNLAQGIIGSVGVENAGNKMAEAVAEAMSSQFRAALDEGEGIGETADSLMLASQTIGLLGSGVERLNLQFDETQASAVAAARSLNEHVGSIDNLVAANDAYYQNYFSETERAASAFSDVYDSLSELTDTVPETKAQYRDLVEAQNLNTKSGAELYAQLVQMSPAFAQVAGSVNDVITSIYEDILNREPDASGLNYYVSQVESGALTVSEALNQIRNSSEAAAISVDDAAGSIDKYNEAINAEEQLRRELLRAQGDTQALRQLEIDELNELAGAEKYGLEALQRRIWSIEDEKEAQQEAERAQQERIRTIQQEASAMARARDQLASFGVSISSYVDNLRSTDAGLGSPADQLAASSQAFYEQYDKAASGDRDAMNSITQYADRFIEAQKGWSASGSQTTATIDKVADMMSQLPDQLSVEQFLADEFKNTITEQTTALNSTLDLNRDGTVSALERTVAAEWDTSDILKSVLAREMQQLGTTVLTDSQVRAALSPHATDAEIKRLIGRVDTNGDGLISQQELTNARIGSLSSGIANAMASQFDSIDINASGLIDYAEFRNAFGDMATDDELKRIFSKLDADGSRSISLFEAQRQLLTAIQGIGANAEGSIKNVEDFFYRAGSPSWGLRVSMSHHQDVNAVRSFGYHTAKEMRREFSPSGTGIGVSLSPAQNGTGARSIATAFKQILGPNTVNGSHSTGLGYVPFDGYIAELHKGEMVATAEDAKVLRELAGGAAMSAPPMPTPRGLPTPMLPAFPLLDQSDQTQLMRDVLNENKKLRADINKLMSGTNKHLAAANTQRGAAAKGQIGAIERGNKMLKKMEDDKRLEAAKR